MTDDHISRRTALETALTFFVEYLGGAFHEDMQVILKRRFEEIPSVQSEITEEDVHPEVLCKNCKYWIPYDWMFSEVWKSRNIDDYSESEIGCTYCDMNMGAMDYCSRGKRKDVSIN